MQMSSPTRIVIPYLSGGTYAAFPKTGERTIRYIILGKAAEAIRLIILLFCSGTPAPHQAREDAIHASFTGR